MLSSSRVLDVSPAKLEIMSDEPAKKHRKLGVSPPQLDFEVVEISESNEENDFEDVGEATTTSLPPLHSGGQRNVHAFLKLQVERLCNVLKQSEDVVHLVGILLEYLVENHDLSKGDLTHLQAIQMSLCWIATDILGRNREASLLEAANKLNFNCDENMANSVYEKLMPLKKTFQQHHGMTGGPISLRNVAPPLTDTAVPCVKAEVIVISDHEENKESKDKIGLDKNQENLRKVQECLEKKRKQLCRRQKKEVQEFNKLWKEKIEKLEEEHAAELAVFRAIGCPSGTKMQKVIEENNKLCKALQDLEEERRALQKKHADEMEEENRKREGWVAGAEAKYGRKTPTINDAKTHELESGNDAINSGSTSSGPPRIIAADALVLDVSGHGEIVVDDKEPVHMQVAIPLPDAPAATNVSLQNPNDLAAAEVYNNVPIVTEIPSTNKDTETNSVILGSHVETLPENEVADEFLSTKGDPKGDSACRSSYLPVDAVNHSQIEQNDCSMQPSTVGKDLADCLKPVDLQTVIASDNGSTMVSPHEHGDSAGFHNQLVALNEGHTMLHDSEVSSIQPSSVGKDPADDYLIPVDQQMASTIDNGIGVEQSVVPCSAKDPADDYLKPVGQQTASTMDTGTSKEQSIVICSNVVSSHEQSDTRVNILDSADCNSRPDSQTAEAPDNICDGEQSAGAQVNIELSDTHVNIADSADCDSRPDLQTAEEMCVGEQSGGAQAHSLSDVAEKTAELQTVVVLPDTSTTVSVDLPLVSGLDPEPISEVAADAPHPHFALPSNQWLLADPLQREFIRMRNEKEQFDKLHTDYISQLNAACEKEILEMSANVRSKYNKKMEDMEGPFTEKKTEVEANCQKLVMNRFLASAFYVISSGSSDVVQPGAPSGRLQQQQSLRPSPIVASSSSPSPVYPVQRYPVASSSSPQPPFIQQTNTPSAQFTPRPTNPSPTHLPPLQIPTVAPNMGTTRVGGSFVRARAPHLQPFRPPPSQGHPTAGTTTFQQVRLGGTNQNARSTCRTSEGPNNRQPEPPRNNYPFSAVELSVTGNVSNAQTLDAQPRHLM